jgi:molybdopterin/thiamine biosynthesis adenylyltransferase
MKFSIVFPEKIYLDCKKFLLRDPNNEQFGYLFTGINEYEGGIKLLVHTFLPAISRNDLEYQSTGGICPSPKFQMNAYSTCKKYGFHLIDVHSHPFDTTDYVRFSSIDDMHEFGSGREGVFGFTAMWNPGMYHASIVFGQKSLDARIYRPDIGHAVPVDEIQVLRKITPTSVLHCHQDERRAFGIPKEIDIYKKSRMTEKKTGGIESLCDGIGENHNVIYSRQILAFGEAGQTALSNTTVAVVGVGGLGSIVVESLARLGIKEIICVDNDILELSNISRILGSQFIDAKKGVHKVRVLERHVKAINPNVKYTSLVDTILNPQTLEVIKNVDYIISGTDTYSSRLVLNQFSIQYLIPYIDLGFGMETDIEHTKLASAGGKVISILPGNWCFYCLGEINQRELQLELMSDEHKQMQISRGYISGVDLPDPSVLFLNMVVASLGVCEFLNLLVPFKERCGYIYYDMLSTKLWNVKVKQDTDCLVCSPEAELIGRGDLIELEDIRDREDGEIFPRII